MKIKSIIFALLLLIMPVAVSAAIPGTINYQANINDAAGTPLQGSQSIVFSIYDVASGGVAIWTSTKSVAVQNGLFSVNLGSTNSFGSLAFDVPYFLGIAVANGAEMSPRQPFTSVPYALRAGDANTVGGKTPAQLQANSIPVGASILTTSNVAPTGFTYTGMQVTVSGPGLAGSWTTKTAPPVTVYRSFVSASVVNGKIYLFPAVGGSTQEYDPATDTWTTKTSRVDANGALLPQVSSQPAVVNGMIYLFGGRGGNTVVANGFKYNPVADIWTATAPLPAVRYAGAVAAVGTTIYYAGGSTLNVPYDTVIAYDTVTDSWSTKEAAGVPITGGQAIALGSFIYMLDRTTFVKYDTTVSGASAWTTVPFDPSISVLGAAMGMLGQKIYFSGQVGVLNQHIEYDLTTGSWTARGVLPVTDGNGSASLGMGGKLYLISSERSALWEYTPSPSVLYVHSMN